MMDVVRAKHILDTWQHNRYGHYIYTSDEFDTAKQVLRDKGE